MRCMTPTRTWPRAVAGSIRSSTLYAPYSNYGPQVAAAFAPLSRVTFGKSLAIFLILTALGYAASVWPVWSISPALHRYGAPVATCRGRAGVLHADSVCAVERRQSSSCRSRWLRSFETADSSQACSSD